MTSTDIFLIFGLVCSVGALVSVWFLSLAAGTAYKNAQTALNLITEVANTSMIGFKNIDAKNTLYESSLKSCYGLIGSVVKDVDELKITISDQDDRVIRQVIEAINRTSN